jgi:hypothetical protein
MARPSRHALVPKGTARPVLERLSINRHHELNNYSDRLASGFVKTE